MQCKAKDNSTLSSPSLSAWELAPSGHIGCDWLPVFLLTIFCSTGNLLLLTPLGPAQMKRGSGSRGMVLCGWCCWKLVLGFRLGEQLKLTFHSWTVFVCFPYNLQAGQFLTEINASLQDNPGILALHTLTGCLQVSWCTNSSTMLQGSPPYCGWYLPKKVHTSAHQVELYSQSSQSLWPALMLPQFLGTQVKSAVWSH